MDNDPIPLRSVRRFAVSLFVFWFFCAVYALVRITYIPVSGRVPYPVGLDANCYYAYAHSLFFRGDLDFTDDYTFITRTQPAPTAEPFAELLKNNAANVFNAGAGIAAVPGLTMAKAFDRTRTLVTGAKPASQFSPLYVFAYYLSNITYGAFALWLTFKILLRWYEPAYAAAACWATVLCGPMLFYMVVDNAMSHCAGAFFGTAAIYSWLRWRDTAGLPAHGFAALAGWCVGFAVCIRPYNAPVAIILVEPLIRKLGRRDSFSSEDFTAAIAAIVGLAAGFFPQMLAWHILTGQWIANTTGYALHIIPEHALQVLFSRRHGLFFWAPALLIAVVALAYCARRQRHPALVFLAIFAAVTYMYGNWWYYWLGVSFGMRGYVDYPYIFALGFAAAITALEKKFAERTIIVAGEIIACCLIINLHLAVAFTGGVTYVDGPLYWLDTISRGRKYKDQLQRLAAPWIDFQPDHRVSLFASPP